MAPLARRRKTKFPTKYLPKWKFWIQLSPNFERLYVHVPVVQITKRNHVQGFPKFEKETAFK